MIVTLTWTRALLVNVRLWPVRVGRDIKHYLLMDSRNFLSNVLCPSVGSVHPICFLWNAFLLPSQDALHISVITHLLPSGGRLLSLQEETRQTQPLGIQRPNQDLCCPILSTHQMAMPN